MSNEFENLAYAIVKHNCKALGVDSTEAGVALLQLREYIDECEETDVPVELELICAEVHAEDEDSLETDTAGYNKESEKVRMCSSGIYRSKHRREEEQANRELVHAPSEKHVNDFSPSPATVSRMSLLYSQFKEQIDYRIKFGSALEKAQSIVIRNMAMGAVAIE
jgi:primase-polymerase (primpol)-like protein